MTDLVEEVARAIAWGSSDLHRRLSRDAARAAIAVVIERCADAVNGLAYGDAVDAVRKLGESE